MSDPIARLRRLSIPRVDSRNREEWTVPVEPSDLRYLLAQYDELVAANTSARRPNSKNDYDMTGSELGNHDI